jgi:hypothetical protein
VEQVEAVQAEALLELADVAGVQDLDEMEAESNI